MTRRQPLNSAMKVVSSAVKTVGPETQLVSIMVND